MLKTIAQKLFNVHRGWTPRLRGICYTRFISIAGGKVGSNLKVASGVTFKYAPHEGISFGNDIVIGERCVIDVPPGGRLSIGDGTTLTCGTLISARKSVSIGELTLVGEYTSIRDNNHNYRARDVPIGEQGFNTTDLAIGADVWIGRGCAILLGTQIGEGSIIAANSMTNNLIPPYSIAAGAPARLVKPR